MSVVYIDVSEFMGSPIRTGIQRVVRAVITNWPAAVPHVFVRHVLGRGLVTVSPEAVRYAVALANEERFDMDEALAEIAFLDRPADIREVQLGAGDRLLAPELFFEHFRVATYREAAARGALVHLIVPDFLVWLRPDRWEFENTNSFMPYLQLVLTCHARAFISAKVARSFETRIARTPINTHDVVLDLGADSLDMEAQMFTPSKTTLLCLGTIDSRKGQERIYQAFCSRSQDAEKLRLVFIGRVPAWTDPPLAELLNTRRHDVTLLTDASDVDVVRELSRARALIYTSPAEGYGLPPMESLHAGVPVVVNRNLPALEGKAADGQVRLPDDDPATITDAIDRLASDEFARDLWDGAKRFPSVTWRSMAESVAAWVAG